MSVKFEKETIRNAPLPVNRNEDVAHKIGERLTGGKSQTGYLAVCASHLRHRPHPTFLGKHQLILTQCS